jgi:anaerobic dimethyl sulfoxide reductase subunit C (anchor subunit)
MLLIGLCLGVGMLASLAHLGTKKRALFALRNLRRSWLSREVLFSGLFGAGWLFTLLASLSGTRNITEWMALTATIGLGFVYSMAQVYRLRAVLVWNTWRTNAGFIVSALLLGQALMTTLLSYEAKAILSIVLILLLIQLALIHGQVHSSPLHTLRIGLIILGVMVSAIGLLLTNLSVAWFNLLIAMLVVMEEGIGRWLFYRSR